MENVDRLTPSTFEQNATRRPGSFSPLWKELSEGKIHVVWSVAVVAILIVGYTTVFPILMAGEKPAFDIRDDILFLVVAFFFSAAITSSSAVSPEIGGANLQFLSSLPLSRRRLWWTKIGSSLLIHLMSMIAVTATFCFLSVIGPGLVGTKGEPQPSIGSVLEECWSVPLLTLSVFSIGTVATMFNDRTLSAFFVTAIVSIVIWALLATLTVVLHPWHYWLIYLLAGLVSILFLYASYTLFLHGETLQTPKRYTIISQIFLFDIVPILLTVAVSYIWLLH